MKDKFAPAACFPSGILRDVISRSRHKFLYRVRGGFFNGRPLRSCKHPWTLFICSLHRHIVVNVGDISSGLIFVVGIHSNSCTSCRRPTWGSLFLKHRRISENQGIHTFLHEGQGTSIMAELVLGDACRGRSSRSLSLTAETLTAISFLCVPKVDSVSLSRAG